MSDDEYRAKLQEMKRQTEAALARAHHHQPDGARSDAAAAKEPRPHAPHRLSGPGESAAAARSAVGSLPEMTKMASDAVEEEDTPEEWALDSWTRKPIRQEVHYDSIEATQKALAQLEHLPPIVSPTEIHALRNHLRSVALGDAFLLQGGDCAELFSYCSAEPIDAKIKLILQMSLVLIYGMNKPIVRVARMAGQYAKPRSSPLETLPSGERVPSFRGDILNGFPLAERTPDPQRLVHAYFHSAATMNYMRAQLASGIADLHRPLDWSLGHVKDPALRARYAAITDQITSSLRFMRTVGADAPDTSLASVELFTSHEALVLEYEQSLTRRLRHPSNRAPTPHAPCAHGWYNTAAHMLWVGDRTRQLDGAHLEYVRGLENPIGVKVGPSMAPADLTLLLRRLDPARTPGKVTLVTRYGAAHVERCLGPHIDAVRAAGHAVVWQCDPMHGNTVATDAGVKTRHFSAILAELAAAMRIHRARGSWLGGVHLELTGDAVTECIGGGEGLVEDDLSLNYTTYCDPRLNEKQALELAFLVAGEYRKDGSGEGRGEGGMEPAPAG